MAPPGRPKFCLLPSIHVVVVVAVVGMLSMMMVPLVASAPYTVSMEDLRSCRGTCCPLKPAPNARIKLWQPPRPHPRRPIVRRSTLTAFRKIGYVRRFRRAYYLLKQQRDKWAGQVGTHCAYCAGEVMGGGNVHQSDLFFPWHRWYLYWHERLLQRLLNDTTFAIPFWDWDNERNRNLSRVYTRRRSVPYDPRRNRNGDSIFGWVKSSASPAQMRAQVLDSAITEVFFGGPYGLEVGGILEGGSHAAVHNGVGMQAYPYHDMGDLSTAANDPVFYAHHANVDRLWTIWKRLPPGANKPRHDPSYPDYLNSTFLFIDEMGDVQQCRVRDALDTLNLGYTYEDVPIEWLPRSTRIAPPASRRRLLSEEPRVEDTDDADCVAMEAYPSVVRHQQATWHLQNSRAASLVEAVSFLATPITVTLALVPVMDRPGHIPTLYSRTGTICRQGAMNAEILSIQGVRWFCRKPVMLHIFVENEKAHMETPKTIENGYLATWQYVPSAIFTRTAVKEVAWNAPLHNFLKLAGKRESKELSFTFVPLTIGPHGNPVPVTDVPEGLAFAKSLSITYK